MRLRSSIRSSDLGMSLTERVFVRLVREVGGEHLFASMEPAIFKRQRFVYGISMARLSRDLCRTIQTCPTVAKIRN
jgi:hypothetical protein